MRADWLPSLRACAPSDPAPTPVRARPTTPTRRAFLRPPGRVRCEDRVKAEVGLSLDVSACRLIMDARPRAEENPWQVCRPRDKYNRGKYRAQRDTAKGLCEGYDDEIYALMRDDTHRTQARLFFSARVFKMSFR